MSLFPLSIMKGSQFHHQPKPMNASLSSDERGKRILIDPDRISKLPDDVLVRILATMSTEDVVKTSALSKRWKSVWKQVPFLHFNMLIDMNKMQPLAPESITQVINRHNGHLEGCSIIHYAHLFKDNVLETWIRLLTLEKQTKAISLSNHHGNGTGTNPLQLSPNIFSHPRLKTLFLYRYDLKTANAFNNCYNLKVLKFEKIFAEVDVFNKIIASCPSLKVLVLHHVMWLKKKACLKIRNNNLKHLHVSCIDVDCIEVYALLLDIFSIYCIRFPKGSNFVIKAPRLLFNNGAIDLEGFNMQYNISRQAQEREYIGHEFVVSRDANYLQRLRSLAVFVDVMNSKQVELLRQILVAWNGVLRELHVLFEDTNVSKEEGESSICGIQNKKWEEGKVFPNADFRVKSVWMYNFSASNKAHFALASHFITQGTVMKELMIMTSLVPANEKLAKEAAVAKLRKLPKGNEMLRIKCF
ncbi:PREDICTED: putative F-box protein At1g67390 [Camelina sativa]|uniref:F-box protein At1g67390 n=1 Tax=Camelina sativa TaxID=90675 RepID=A0ABM0Z7W7_CAMSA|nr:PREDICTED: putative F-box protein At1g67390 [Camelina sativa]